jgi:hypothetical protein
MKRVIALLASLLALAGILTTVPAGAATSAVTITCTPTACVGSGQLGPLLVYTQHAPAGDEVVICLGTKFIPCKIAGGAILITPRFIFAGAATPVLDAEVIITAHSLTAFLGNKRFLLEVNGSPGSALVVYYTAHIHRCITWDGSNLRNVRC